MTRARGRLRLRTAAQGRIKLLYLAPERLQRDNFIARMDAWNVAMFRSRRGSLHIPMGLRLRPSTPEGLVFPRTSYIFARL